MSIKNYDNLRKMRELIIQEIAAQFGGLITLEHYILAEHRLQSAIVAGFGYEDIQTEKKNFADNALSVISEDVIEKDHE